MTCCTPSPKRDAHFCRENRMIEEIHLGDVVKMRKPHPCGGYEWEIVRLGADIGIRCRRCGRRVLLPRSQFQRQVKALVAAAPPASVPDDAR